MARDGVPVGTTVEFDWTDSVVYPGTTRKFWVHVPARYEPAEPAGLMVFPDGQWYLDPDGELRGAIVLDNLMHSGDLPRHFNPRGPRSGLGFFVLLAKVNGPVGA